MRETEQNIMELILWFRNSEMLSIADDILTIMKRATTLDDLSAIERLASFTKVTLIAKWEATGDLRISF